MGQGGDLVHQGVARGAAHVREVIQSSLVNGATEGVDPLKSSLEKRLALVLNPVFSERIAVVVSSWGVAVGSPARLSGGPKRNIKFFKETLMNIIAFYPNIRMFYSFKPPRKLASRRQAEYCADVDQLGNQNVQDGH